MRLKHTNHGHDPCWIFTLKEEIQVVQNGSEVRAKPHDLIRDFGEVVLVVVINKPRLSEALNIGELESLESVATGEQFALEDVGVVFFTDGADIDVQRPTVFLEDANNLLLPFIGCDVEGVVGLLGRRGKLLGKQFASRPGLGESDHGEPSGDTTAHFAVKLRHTEGADAPEKFLILGVKGHLSCHASSPQRRTT